MSLPSQEIPHVLWNPNFHFRIHNSPPILRILRNLNSIQVLSTYSFKMHFSIIVPFTPPLGFPGDLLHSGFHTKTLYTFLLLLKHKRRQTAPFHVRLK